MDGSLPYRSWQPSERRLYRSRLVPSQLLPPGLVGQDRPNIGMMVPQTTAAALVSENKALGWPASLDSIPTCEDQEDHIAMSTVASRRARQVLRSSQRVIAIELISAYEALRYRINDSTNTTLGTGVKVAVAHLESVLSNLSITQRLAIIEVIALDIHQGLINANAQPDSKHSTGHDCQNAWRDETAGPHHVTVEIGNHPITCEDIWSIARGASILFTMTDLLK